LSKLKFFSGSRRFRNISRSMSAGSNEAGSAISRVWSLVDRFLYPSSRFQAEAICSDSGRSAHLVVSAIDGVITINTRPKRHHNAPRPLCTSQPSRQRCNDSSTSSVCASSSCAHLQNNISSPLPPNILLINSSHPSASSTSASPPNTATTNVSSLSTPHPPLSTQLSTTPPSP